MEEEVTRADERRAFILLVVILAPVLAVAIVGGYGFAVWMSQLLSGPPAG
jgi:nitrate reductase NapE